MISAIQYWLESTVTREEVLSALQQRSGQPKEKLAPIAAIISSFVCSMPQAVAAMYALANRRECKQATSFVAGQVLYYLADEEDLLPDTKFGALGLLDDAYFAHSTAIALMRAFPYVDLSATNYTIPNSQVFEAVRTILPSGVAEALDRTAGNLVHLATSLFGSAFAADENAVQVMPVLRIDDAVAMLSRGKDIAGEEKKGQSA